MRKWSKEIIIKRIQKLEGLEIDLSAQYISTREPLFYRAAQRYFSNWRNALKAAGIDYEKEIEFSLRLKQTKSKDGRIRKNKKTT
jgi:hypothetical protein